MLNRAIGSLTRARDALADLYDGRPYRVGRCMAVDENGRCSDQSNHERDQHDFPTEEQAYAAATAHAHAVRQVRAVPA